MKLGHIILTILLVWTLSYSVHGQCPDQFTEVVSDSFVLHSDIHFGDNISENGEAFTALLDLYLPTEESEDLRPLVILAHGGSFTGGNKRDGEVRWICEDLARRGIVAASINYRVESNPLSLLSEEKMVKAVIRTVEDNKAAIRFFYKHIEEGNSWGIDPAYIFSGGSSAGSIGCLHSAFMDEYPILKPKWKRWIQDLNIDTLEMNGNSGNEGYADSIAGIINISGAIASLNFLDNNNDIPIISIHNSGDLSVPYRFGFPYFIPTLPIVAGSRPIHQRMLGNGGTSKLVTYEAVNHVPHTEFITGDQLFPEYDEILEHILEFLGEHVGCDELPTIILNHEVIELKAYPNPVSKEHGIIRISGWEEQHSINFSLYRSDGQLIIQQMSPVNGIIQLPEQISNGLYFMIGKNDSRQVTYSLSFIVLD